MKIIFLILDGLADQPVEKFNFKTPLQLAQTPNLDFLAKEGRVGLLLPIPGEAHPSSEKAHFAIFGYDLQKEFPQRGPLEALGINIPLSGKEVVFRANFATLDKEGNLVDPRAGRIKDIYPLCKAIDGIKIDGVLFRIYPSLEHRAVLVLEGEMISEKVFGNDPHKLPPFKLGVPLLKFKPQNHSQEAKFTSEVLNKYLLRVQTILEKHPENKKRIKEKKPPANTLLVREGGRYFSVPSFSERYKLSAVCIAGAPLYKGIGKFLGMDVLEVEGANGTPTTNLENKFKAAQKALLNYDFVFVHIKACDLFGEDGNCEGKKQFIEKIDKHLPLLIKTIKARKDAVLVIAADHATPCILKAHSGDPVPLLVFNGQDKDEVESFSEEAVKEGSLGLMKDGELLRFLLS